MPMLPSATDDDLFEQSYLIDVLPSNAMAGLNDAMDGTSIPLALVSASYGYTREGQHSALLAGLFGFFGYQYPLLAAAIIATDAVLVQGTPAGAFLKGQYSKHSPALKARVGLSGLSMRRCRSGYRRRSGRCVRR